MLHRIDLMFQRLKLWSIFRADARPFDLRDTHPNRARATRRSGIGKPAQRIAHKLALGNRLAQACVAPSNEVPAARQ